MANNVGLEFASKTDTGLVRSQNEDSIAISPTHGFAILADGMGGYNAGEIASSIATSVSKDCLEHGLALVHDTDSRLQRNRQLHQLVGDAIHRANASILTAAQEEPRYNGMGTTMIAAVFHHESVVIGHVGDSRAYRFRTGQVEQITRDHSLLQEQIDAGLVAAEAARFSLNKNLVTRAVGVAHDMEVEIHEHQTQQGDIYLLCSDGLSDMVSDNEISDILSRKQLSLDMACEALVQIANDHGGLDNISAILIRVQSTAPEGTGLLGRILNWVN